MHSSHSYLLMGRYRGQGFALVPVSLMLALLGVVAFLLTREAATGTALIGNVVQKESADNVNEAALAHAQWLANSSNCRLPDDVSNLEFAGATYDLKFTGTPDNFSITSTTRTAVGEQVRTQQNLRLYDYSKPHRLDTVAAVDSYIKLESRNAFKNYGDEEKLHISSEANKLEKMLFQFDISSIPPDAKVDSAFLNLNIESNEGHSEEFLLHAVTNKWRERSVSSAFPWRYAGGDHEQAASSTFTVSQLGLVSADVTGLAAAWVSLAKQNYGVLIRMEASATRKHMRVHSKEEADSSKRPSLQVNYVCACGVDCVAGVVLDDFVFAYAEAAEVLGQRFETRDLVYVSRKDKTSHVELPGGSHDFPDVIRAAHKLANGRYLLAFKADYSSAGTFYHAEDLVEYDANSGAFRVVLDGSKNDLESAVSAATLSISGRLAIALAQNDEVFGEEYEKSDLFYIDPVLKSTEMLFDGSEFNLNEQITSAHLLHNGNLVLSFDTDGSTLGLDFENGDLLQFNLADKTVQMYSRHELFSEQATVLALSIGAGQGSISSLEFHFPFAEQAGSEARDVMLSRIGRINDVPRWRPGGLNGSLGFDGLHNNMSFSSDSLTELNGSFSLLFWAKNEASQLGEKWVVNKSLAGDDNSLLVGYRDNQPHWSLTMAGEELSIGPLVDVEVEQWHHYAIVFNPSSSTAETYINGSLQDSSHIAFSSTANVHDWLIGEAWAGVLDELRYYNYPLTDKEVKAYAEQELVDPDVIPPPPGESGSGEGEGDGEDVSCKGGVADFLDAVAYNNSNGTLNWLDPWIEYGDDQLPYFGSVRVFGFGQNKSARFNNSDKALYRKLPLSHATTVQLSFEVVGLGLQPGQYLSVRVTDNGPGNDWVELQRIDSSTPTTAALGNRFSFDISSYISENMYISFHTSSNMGIWDWVNIDNVQARCLP